MIKKKTVLLTLLLLTPLDLSAQAKMERGPAHQRLDFLVGQWQVQSKMYFRGETHEGESRVTYSWQPGGVWLEEDLDLPHTPIGPMHGSARMAWDEASKAYVYYYVDNQSTVLLPAKGRWVDDKKLEFKGSFEWLDGTVFHTRRVIEKLADGWSEATYMGTDPDNLSLNHEGKAVAATPAAAAASKPAPEPAEESVEALRAKALARLRADSGTWTSRWEFLDAEGQVANVMEGTEAQREVLADGVFEMDTEVPAFGRRSKSLTFFNPITKKIVFFSVGHDGDHWMLTQDVDGHVLASEPHQNADGSESTIRFTVLRETEDEKDILMEHSADGGETWNQVFKQYMRRPPAEGAAP